MAETFNPFRPHPHIVELAQRIRLSLGTGGANFPGAAELYKAAEKIEAWTAEEPAEAGSRTTDKPDGSAHAGADQGASIASRAG